MNKQLSREEAGKLLQNNIERIDEFEYKIKSASSNEVYQIISTELGWICSCPDHMYRGIKCKHIYAVEFSLELRKSVEIKRIEPVFIEGCKYCGSSRLVKSGLRRNKHDDLQKFGCKDCHRLFTVNLGFEKMKHNPQGITTAMQLYFSGESLRNTSRSLKLIGMNVSHQTVYNWISKYTLLMERYLDKIMPKVSSTWRTDEVYLKIKDNTKYLYALMDDETRFWIAQQMAETKYDADVRPLFQKAKRVAGKRSLTFISDGAPNFHQAYNRVLFGCQT